MTKEEFIKYVFDTNSIRLTDDQFYGKRKINFRFGCSNNLDLRDLTSIP